MQIGLHTLCGLCRPEISLFDPDVVRGELDMTVREVKCATCCAGLIVSQCMCERERRECVPCNTTCRSAFRAVRVCAPVCGMDAAKRRRG